MRTVATQAQEFENAVQEYVTRPDSDEEPVTHRWMREEEVAPETMRSPTQTPQPPSHHLQLAKLIKHKLREQMVLSGPINQRPAGFDHAEDVSFDVLVPGDATSSEMVEAAMTRVLGKATQTTHNLHIWDKARVRVVWAHKPNEANWVRVMDRVSARL